MQEVYLLHANMVVEKKNKLEINKYKFKQARVGKQAFLGVWPVTTWVLPTISIELLTLLNYFQEKMVCFICI